MKKSETPSLNELRVVAKLAKKYLDLLDLFLAKEILKASDLAEEGPALWKTIVISKTNAWLDKLENADSGLVIGLALDALYDNGFNVSEEIWHKSMEKVLCISTAHIKPETAGFLGKSYGGDPVIFYPHGEYGYLVHVPTDLTELSYVDNFAPLDLRDCVIYAFNLGCVWLLIDMDGGILPELKTYSWGA